MSPFLLLGLAANRFIREDDISLEYTPARTEELLQQMHSIYIEMYARKVMMSVAI